MLECGCNAKEPLLVTATINEWDADDEQVARNNWDRGLVTDWVDTGSKTVTVGWHLCPICKKPIGEPWIEGCSNP